MNAKLRKMAANLWNPGDKTFEAAKTYIKYFGSYMADYRIDFVTEEG